MISRTRALQLMQGNGGRFFSAVFVTKDSRERMINCRFLKDQPRINLGYVLVEDMSVQSGSKIRTINMQTLKSISIQGTKQKIRGS